MHHRKGSAKRSRLDRRPVAARPTLRAALLVAAVLLALSAPSLGTQESSPARALGDHSRQYVDTEDNPLPFANDEQILEFLETADVVEETEAAKGINHIQRLTLQRGDVRAYAAFRAVDVSRSRHRLPNGWVVMLARDSYRYDPAAYWVNRLLGLDAVPPAILRRHRNVRGSLQLWIGNVIDEQERAAADLPPPGLLWHQHSSIRALFDNLIANYDRNQTNILLDPETWRVWLIDHGRAFLVDDRLIYSEDLTSCARGVFERLRTLDEETVRARLDDYLDRAEIRAFLRRRQALVDLIELHIAEHGESAVLFDR